MKKVRKCYLYTRVSTSMQVDGYSLDAQKEKLRKYADYEEMIIVNEYSDEGKSGKSVEGRPQFQQMLKDIAGGKDGVAYVLVFKLSRFGRNAADVLNSLQMMQDYGVNLICVEDGIDSSKDSGKLMISVLSAVAEIERENILVQTMEGRRQKAREGRWNGGFAPYGYTLKNGELKVVEEEAEAIRIIFDKYVHTTMGISGIAKYLEQQGIRKKVRQNGKLTQFSTTFIKGVLDNPVYYGKISYGRRKTEKVNGTRNEYHIVKQDKFLLYDGLHEAIVPEEIWRAAQSKRKQAGGKWEKTHSLEHEHILSGILKCPVCGAGMYGNVNRKKRADGTYYRDYFYYACKHRLKIDGHSCDYTKQWGEDKINNAVAEVVKKLVQNPRFAELIKEKINMRIDTKEIDIELEQCQKQLTQFHGTKHILEKQIDSLSVTDKHFEKKLADLQRRLDAAYDKISDVEKQIEEYQIRKKNIEAEKIKGDKVYQYLLCFDKMYEKFTDLEKKKFFKSFVKQVDIYEDEQPGGQILKHIKFCFPVVYNGQDITDISWDKESSVETVVLMSRKDK